MPPIESPRSKVRIAQNLVALRRMRGLTQLQVATALGVTTATISNHERGETLPDDLLIEKYGEVYQVSPGIIRYSDVTTRLGPDWLDPTPSPSDRQFSRQIRLREKEVEIELVNLGATDEEVAGFGKSLRGNPLLVSAFSGGAPTNLTEEQILQLFDGAAIGYTAIVKMLIEEREKEARRR